MKKKIIPYKEGNSDTERICKGCGEKKELTRENFYFHQDYFVYTCILCMNRKSRERYKQAQLKKSIASIVTTEPTLVVAPKPVTHADIGKFGEQNKGFWRSYSYLL